MLSATALAAAIACMAVNVHQEAEGQSLREKMAVALVIRNRTKHPDFPKSVCEVVRQKGQFAHRLKALRRQVRDRKAWKESLQASRRVLSGAQHDFTGGALYFVNQNFPWRPARKLQRLPSIGRFALYTQREAVRCGGLGSRLQPRRDRGSHPVPPRCGEHAQSRRPWTSPPSVKAYSIRMASRPPHSTVKPLLKPTFLRSGLGFGDQRNRKRASASYGLPEAFAWLSRSASRAMGHGGNGGVPMKASKEKKVNSRTPPRHH
jgi:hypothetical protein